MLFRIFESKKICILISSFNLSSCFIGNSSNSLYNERYPSVRMEFTSRILGAIACCSRIIPDVREVGKDNYSVATINTSREGLYSLRSFYRI